MTDRSRLAQLVGPGRAKIVHVDECDILCYRPQCAIVTENLASCHAVVLQSPIAVILAHISPRPSLENADDLTAGDRHVARLMDRVISLYMAWRAWFPPGSSAWGVYAWNQEDGAIALGDQQAIIQRKLAPTRLPVYDRYYSIPRARDAPARLGTVLSGWIDDNRVCSLYVEDHLQNRLTVRDEHIRLGADLSRASREASGSGRPSDAPSTELRPTHSTMPSEPAQRSVVQSVGDAAVLAATMVLRQIGIDPSVSRPLLRDAIREVQQRSPTLADNYDAAAQLGACVVIVRQSPGQMSVDDAKVQLRRAMAAYLAVAGPSVPQRQNSDDEASSDESSNESSSEDE